MKLFLDSASLVEIQTCLQHGLISGVTTNPSILAKEKNTTYSKHILSIIELLNSCEADIPLSIEVTSVQPTEMLRQATQFMHDFSAYRENLYVKIPIGWSELQTITNLRTLGVKVNCTCCMSYNQCIAAANAGASYVSIFWGRIRDVGYDAASVVRDVHTTFRQWNCPTKIIVGSIRQMIDINEAIQAGADIVTVPFKFFPQMCVHPKTDEAVSQFMRDFAAWNT